VAKECRRPERKQVITSHAKERTHPLFLSLQHAHDFFHDSVGTTSSYSRHPSCYRSTVLLGHQNKSLNWEVVYFLYLVVDGLMSTAGWQDAQKE
jgi:hypothetical protein